jgi:hypothetical protein
MMGNTSTLWPYDPHREGRLGELLALVFALRPSWQRAGVHAMSVVTLREITAATVRVICTLETTTRSVNRSTLRADGRSKFVGAWI